MNDDFLGGRAYAPLAHTARAYLARVTTRAYDKMGAGYRLRRYALPGACHDTRLLAYAPLAHTAR